MDERERQQYWTTGSIECPGCDQKIHVAQHHDEPKKLRLRFQISKEVFVNLATEDIECPECGHDLNVPIIDLIEERG